MIGWIILVIIVVVVGYGVVAYNNLVRQRQLSQEGWSGIDVQLKRRADLIPNLMESVKGYMAHERETLEAVTKARTDADGRRQRHARAARRRPKARCRRRWAGCSPSPRPIPTSRPARTSCSSRARCSNTEDEIQLSRRYYNGTARDLNTAVESFPSNILANIFHFEKVQYFEIDNPADRAVPQVKF